MFGVDSPRDDAQSFVVEGLHLVRVGPADGHVVVALHGGPGDAHDYFRPYLDGLASASRGLVYYDQRGGGRSALADGRPPVDWRGHLADVEAVRRCLRATSIDLLGFSWGAMLALLHAIEHRGHVRRLMLVSPPPVLAPYEREMAENVRTATARPEVQAFLASLDEEVHPRTDPASELQRRFCRSVAPFLFEPARALSLRPVESRAEVRDAAARSLRVADIAANLPSLRGTRTLILRGDRDPVPAESAEEIARTIGARLVTFQRCGHAPFAEVEEDFIATVRAFLDEPT
jgi:proline iminopeptidase